MIGKAHGEGLLEGWAAAESASGDVQLKPIVDGMFTKVEMHVTGSAVSVRPWLSPDGEDAALLYGHKLSAVALWCVALS